MFLEVLGVAAQKSNISFGTYLLSTYTATRRSNLKSRGALAPLSKPTLSTQMYNGA